jgi:hypothetical protein
VCELCQCRLLSPSVKSNIPDSVRRPDGFDTSIGLVCLGCVADERAQGREVLVRKRS